MPTLTFTPQQAQHVAGLIQQAQAAQDAYQQAVALLTLGADLPAGATLASVDTDTGVFTFTDPSPAPAPTQRPHAA